MRVAFSAKNVFIILAVFIFLMMMFVATRVGTGGDEVIDAANGKYSLEYYCNGDTTFVDYSKVPLVREPHMKYYGVGFEIIPAILIKYCGISYYEYPFRHMLCGALGFLFILFSALCAKQLKDWKLASLTLLIMALTPTVFGLSFNDSKDVPMAAGYAIAIFGFLKIYKKIPDFSWSGIILAMIGIAWAVSIRIGGLMLVLYLGVGMVLVFLIRKDLRDQLFKGQLGTVAKFIGVSAFITFLGVLIGLCAYPNFFYEGPVGHVTNAIKLVSKFQARIVFLFQGEIAESTNVPDYYLLITYLITIPLFVWSGILLFIIFIKKTFQRYDKAFFCFFLFMALFPPVYITYTDANIYNGWRHTLFFLHGFRSDFCYGNL